MSAGLMFIVLCAIVAAYLFGMFSAFMIADRNSLKDQINDYQRARQRELNQKYYNNWDHPAYQKTKGVT